MKARNARIDTLRVVAMLMIICGHFIYHGMRHVGLQESTGVPFADSAVGRMNFVMAQFLGYACNIATNIYFMITGYFLVKPRTLSYAVSKSWKLWRTIVFYTLSVYAVLCATGALDFSVSQLIEQLMPIHSRKYWFMSNYIVVLLLSPFVSKALDALAKKEYQGLLLVLLLLNFAEGSWGYGGIFSGGMSVVFCLSLFTLGGYLKKFPLPAFRFDHVVYLVGYLSICLFFTLNSYVGQLGVFGDADTLLNIRALANNSVPLLSSVCFFLVFASGRWSVPNGVSRLAVGCSPYIMAVYLIHDNVYLRPLLWDGVVRPLNYVNSCWFLPYCVAVVVAVFVLCLSVEYVRQKVVSLIKK